MDDGHTNRSGSSIGNPVNYRGNNNQKPAADNNDGSSNNKLSYEERNPTFIQQCLDDLDEEIYNRIDWPSSSRSPASATNTANDESGKQTTTSLSSILGGVFVPEVIALRQALELDPNYLRNNRQLKLSFLRSERYKPKEAMEKMIKFFEQKKMLFGVDKLAKRITIDDDLTQEDIHFLNKGFLQIVPVKDRAGRIIYFAQQPYMDNEDQHRESIVSLTTCLVCTLFCGWSGW